MKMRILLLGLALSAAWLARFTYAAEKPWETKWAARVAEGKVPGFNDYLTSGFWVVGAFNLGVVLVLLATAWWWTGWVKQPARKIVLTPARQEGSRRFWLVVLLAVVAGAVPRGMRMDHSLWGDEAWAAGSYTHGVFEPVDGQQGELQFEPADWAHAVFDDRGGGNNHVLMTVLGRLSSTVWRAATGEPREHFSEVALRVPNLVAGLLAIVAVACLLRAAGLPGAGMIGAWLFALHPWAIRYGSEARGYGLLMLGYLCAFWMLARALETGRWRFWWGFAAAQAAMLLSWAGAAHPVIALNLAALWLLLSRGGFHLPTLVRWVFANVAAAAVFLSFYIPRHYQIVHMKERTTGLLTFPSHLSWWDDLVFHLLAGSTLENRFPSLPHPNALEVYFGHIWPGVVALVVAAGAVVSGAVYLVRQGRGAFGVIVGSALLAAALAIVHIWLVMGEGLLFFYLSYLLPPLVVFAAVGISKLGKFAPLGVLAVAAFWAKPVINVVTVPVERLREAWEATRGRHEEFYYTGPSDVRTCILWRSAAIYSPRTETHARDLSAVRDQMRAAREAGDELYVTIGNLGFVYRVAPDLKALLEDPGEFEKVGDFPGVNPIVSLKCYRMLSGTSASGRAGSDGL